MGLNPGPVPARVDATVKAGLLRLLDHALEKGWSVRRAGASLGLDHSRLLSWLGRREEGRLGDTRPGPHEALHALLDWERSAVLELAKEWGEVDRSHRKLAHRGSRLSRVHVSESTVLRVLEAAGMRLPAAPGREPLARTPWPQWATWEPNSIWVFDFVRHEAP